MEIPLVAGRPLGESDNQQAPPVILVNQTLARKFWPGQSAIGRRIAIDLYQGKVAEIVGVVGDVKPDRIDGDEWPTIYNHAQGAGERDDAVVRTAGAPMALAR
jgi:hypothetical protein